jgi:hypothetical protein
MLGPAVWAGPQNDHVCLNVCLNVCLCVRGCGVLMFEGVRIIPCRGATSRISRLAPVHLIDL